MNYKRIILILSVFLFGGNFFTAQAGRLLIEQDTVKLFIGSGNNEILIPGLDFFSSKNPTVEVELEDPELLEILSFDYTAGYPFAIVQVDEKGKRGIVSLKTYVSFDGGKDTLQTVVSIVPYHNPGMIFEIHDAIFWQEAVPLSGSAVFDTIIQTSQGPYQYLNYNEIPLTVNLDCNDPSICTGHDFFTSFYKGYFIPPVDGTYYFYMQSQDRHAMWLSPSEKFSEAKYIVGRTSTLGNAGTEVGSSRTKSEPQQLTAGKVYAFYAAQWIIHSTIGGILYEGPGISMDYIPGENTMPYYDILKPTKPENLIVEWKTSTKVMLGWQPSIDDGKISGYNLYLNGSRFNTATIKDTSFLISDLLKGSDYYISVTAVDRVGNESFFSNILAVKTFEKDTVPPSPPTEMTVEKATGLALQINWSGSVDNETEVIGYHVFVDGEKYNDNGFVADNGLIVRNLLPSTSYKITIEAIDGGMNVSEKSEEFMASTGEFDPLGPTLGVKSGKVIVENKNTSWNEGIGLNGQYENGSMVNDPQIRQLVKDFKAGVIRWGAISANSKSFEGSVGTGKANTYGKMLSLANEIGAYFALTVGVQDGIDYRTDPKTFSHLLEYLAGDATTTWGAVRVSEGFTEPLLQNSKGVLLEFGNEVWGAAAHDAEIGSNYTEYGNWAREMAKVVKESPYYDPEKIIMVYSGRNPSPNTSYGVNNTVLTGDRGEVDCLAVSGYLGGNLNYDPEIPQGESELDYYKNGIELMKTNMEGFFLSIQEMFSLTGTLKTFYLYESNMTTSSYNGRFGQAIIMTDYMIGSMNYGSIVPSIFHLTGGQWRITRPTENYRELPLFTMGKYFNRFCKGNNLQTELVTNDKLTNSFGREISFNPVGTYAYNNGEQFSVVLINRDFENSYTIQLALPEDLNFNDDAKIYTLWNDDFSSYDTNIDSAAFSLSGNRLVTLPKHSMVVISVNGDDPEYEKLPLGYFDRERPDSLKITSNKNFSIDTNRGTDVITVQVFPEEAFSTAAILDVIENTTESILTPLSGGRLHIKGSGACEGNGYIKIHIYAADNHELSDTVVVTVSNQGTDCPSTGITEWDNSGGPLFYPNPTADMVYFNRNIDGKSQLQVYSSSGEIIINRKLNTNYKISTGNLASGIYFISIRTSDGKYFSGKLQKH
ncbi:MAG: fibronectin type III domain-containing protein [Draconibacterium sp.]